YLGFVFARDATPAAVEAALREAHRRLRSVITAPGEPEEAAECLPAAPARRVLPIRGECLVTPDLLINHAGLKAGPGTAALWPAVHGGGRQASSSHGTDHWSPARVVAVARAYNGSRRAARWQRTASASRPRTSGTRRTTATSMR